MQQKVLIVGASSGIGKEMAIKFLEKGYKVGITARREAKLIKIKEIYSKDTVICAFDCTQNNATDILASFINTIGGMDILIFCAGTGDLNENLDVKIEENTYNLNVQAFTKIICWAYDHFQQQGFGQIVAITSIAGIRGSGIAPAYNASKAYQINYLEGLRQKSQKVSNSIQITDIRPGFVDTAMAKGDKRFWVASPKKVAVQIIKLIESKKDVGYVTKKWRLIGMLLKIIPRFIYKKL